MRGRAGVDAEDSIRVVQVRGGPRGSARHGARQRGRDDTTDCGRTERPVAAALHQISGPTPTNAFTKPRRSLSSVVAVRRGVCNVTSSTSAQPTATGASAANASIGRKRTQRASPSSSASRRWPEVPTGGPQLIGAQNDHQDALRGLSRDVAPPGPRDSELPPWSRPRKLADAGRGFESPDRTLRVVAAARGGVGVDSGVLARDQIVLGHPVRTLDGAVRLCRATPGHEALPGPRAAPRSLGRRGCDAGRLGCRTCSARRRSAARRRAVRVGSASPSIRPRCTRPSGPGLTEVLGP